jgi:hypothetical protein
VTGRPPLWTPEEAKADAEREGEPELTRGQKAFGGCLGLAAEFATGCVPSLIPFVLVGAWLLLR